MTEPVIAIRVPFVVYDDKGLILRAGSAEPDTLEANADGKHYLVATEPLPPVVDITHYVDVATSTLKARQALDVEPEYTVAADGETMIELTLPEGTVIAFDGVDHASEETFSFATDTPGAYVFVFHPPVFWLSTEVTIHAV